MNPCNGQVQAYTLGLAASYDAALAYDPSPIKKIGKRDLPDDQYPGGWVWRTMDEAEKYMQDHKDDDFFRGREFAVYRLILPTGWDVDVYGPDADGIHNLLNDAEIMGRVYRPMNIPSTDGNY